MENTSDPKFRTTLKNVRLYFDFLFKRGFRIVAVMIADQQHENWQVTLTADHRLIEIYSVEGQIHLALGALRLNDEIKFFDLEELAYLVNHGREFFYKPEAFKMDEAQQFKRIARFLEKNMDVLLAEVERTNPLILKHPAFNSSTQQKRTIA